MTSGRMALSIYVHIPYCLQRCRYCDFTTFEFNQILAPEKYLELVRSEIRNRHAWAPTKEVATVYFGGGTPSLVPADHIVAILDELANVGFRFTADCEMTIEINPATVDPEKLKVYLERGINRFSVGAQTFDDALLSACNRRHTAQDTRDTLELLNSHGLNVSFDLLFALPGQSLADLKSDLGEVERYAPSHLSAYCLTLPQGHPMEIGRPPEDEQVAMFELIEDRLGQQGLLRYEISNFARPGRESRHNLSYWRDRPYWGVGLSAHSYFPRTSTWGQRFWNPKVIADYAAQVSSPAPLPANQIETLRPYEALTDFCHMFLRTSEGLPLSALRNKFGERACQMALARLQTLLQNGYLTQRDDFVQLTARGRLMNNYVLSELLFLAQDWPLPELPSLP